jgi:hypothetical protein
MPVDRTSATPPPKSVPPRPPPHKAAPPAVQSAKAGKSASHAGAAPQKSNRGSADSLARIGDVVAQSIGGVVDELGRFVSELGHSVASAEHGAKKVPPSRGPDVWGGRPEPAMPSGDERYLRGLNGEIQAEVYGQVPSERSKIPTGEVHSDTRYEAEQYLAGKSATASTSSGQRLADVLNALGPADSYALLTGMQSSDIERLGLQNSLNDLVKSGQFTASDAAKLPAVQLLAAQSSIDPYASGNVNDNNVSDLIDGLPQDGSNVKIGYANACLSSASSINAEIARGKTSGEVHHQVVLARNSLYQQASDAAAGATGNDTAKIAIFNQFLGDAGHLAGPNAAATSSILHAYAANVLGTLSDKSEIASTLTNLGGASKDGYIQPGSRLDQFLSSALSGQAQFGFGVSNSTAPLAEVPRGITSLLSGLAGSGDPKLMAGALDNVAQWSMAQPAQAQVLAAQDGIRGTGYRAALTDLLNRSFNQLVALDPSDPGATVLRTLQPQVVADFQVLSGIELGPPFDTEGAGNFAGTFNTHAIQFAAYAAGVHTPGTAGLTKLLASAGDSRNAAAVIYGQLANTFIAGYNQNDGALAKEADRVAVGLYHARIGTDIARAVGTGLLLSSVWVTGGGDIPILFGATADRGVLVSIVGRTGLFSGSVGTFIIDANEDPIDPSNAYQSFERQQASADAGPVGLMTAMYNGWFSKISQLDPGGSEGQNITNGVLSGSSFPSSAIEQNDAKYFFNNYDPLGYYKDQTGSYPPVAPARPSKPAAPATKPAISGGAPERVTPVSRPPGRGKTQTTNGEPNGGPTGRADAALAREGYKAITVKSGETIWGIAAQNGANPEATVALNAAHIANPDLIYSGDVIYLPKSES